MNPVLLFAVVLIATFSTCAPDASARTWTSADGKSTMEGDLIAYDAGTGKVTMEREGKKITFDQKALSATDIAFLREKGSIKPVADAAPVKRPQSSSGGPLPPDYLVEATKDTDFEDQGGYYEVPPFFTPYPKANDKKGWQIQNFGPVGIGISLKDPGMTMEITNVEEGSPADKTGKLKKGQIIESINGVEMTGIDPRIVLGKLITDAEATDGRIDLEIKGLGRVAVSIPVMGSYSPTWPLDCPKSDKIVRNLADLLAKTGKDEWGSVLFLLSTGEEKDLEVVRGWMKELKEVGAINWAIGYQGMGVCEYYLRTGDSSVLPVIQKGADHLRDHIYNGGWAGRTGSYGYQSGGHLNAAGVHCLTFLLLAKTCGVDVDEATLSSSLRHFYRYSGRGSVPYGDYTPKSGFRDCNGKTSGLAIAMAAASRLTPDGEKDSVYAQAAQINAMKSFYGTNDFHMGHTGGGIGEIWKSASMGLVAETRPKQYRSYMDARWWILELSRRHNGGIGIGGGPEGNYDKATGEDNKNIAWGTYLALTYTLPRKHLHLFGAPRSEWAKSFTLPERPWGTKADDDFSSPYPAPGGPWSQEDAYDESVENNAGQAVEALLGGSDVSEEDIMTYLHHPEITFRGYALDAVLRLKKHDMLLELLQSEDARLRHKGAMGLHELLGTWRPQNKDPNKVTPAMWGRVEEIIRDPEESWFVKQWAMGLLQHTDLEKLRTFKDLLATLAEHEEHWLQGTAISASQPLLADPESYKTLFPPIVRAISSAKAYPIVTRASEITKGLDKASREIQEYAINMLKPAYLELPQEMVSERGIFVVPSGGAIKRASIGKVVGFSDEGMDFLNSMPKVTAAWKASGDDKDLYVFDGTFKPNPDFHGKWNFLGHDKVKDKNEALALIKKRLEENKVPSASDNKITYGFSVEKDGGVTPLRYSNFNYTKPMRYSGNMVFSTFVDIAFHFEILSVEDRKYLMLESHFEPEQEDGYETSYMVYVQVND